mgnify:CR=1 FL=1
MRRSERRFMVDYRKFRANQRLQPLCNPIQCLIHALTVISNRSVDAKRLQVSVPEHVIGKHAMQIGSNDLSVRRNRAIGVTINPAEWSVAIGALRLAKMNFIARHIYTKDKTMRVDISHGFRRLHNGFNVQEAQPRNIANIAFNPVRKWSTWTRE